MSGARPEQKHRAADMTPDVTWRDITPACNIFEPGTSEMVNTGDWRTERPIFDAAKCRQCALCIPVCPDMAIPADAEGRRGEFNYFFCKGCGICAEVCPAEGAITMVPEAQRAERGAA